MNADTEHWNQVRREFPGDPALQQIHIARKLITEEADSKGMTLSEYISDYRTRAEGIFSRHRTKSR